MKIYTFFNFDNDTLIDKETAANNIDVNLTQKDNNRDDLTISDSFLEQAITTHLFDDEFDLQEEVDKTDKQTLKKQTENRETEGEREKNREWSSMATTPKKNVENNLNAANANENVSL